MDGYKIFLIDAGATIKDAMSKMDENGKRVLFVVSPDKQMVGVITDGDIRRWILNGGDINESIKLAYNAHPKFLYKDYDPAEVKRIMTLYNIESVPIIDEHDNIINVLFWDEVFEQKEKSKKKLGVPVVIMAGGKGSRLEPFTRILPKPLIPIGESTIVEIIMDNFFENGLSDFHLVLNYKGDMIKSYLKSIKMPFNLHFISEEEYGGTVRGLKLLPADFPNTFIVSNCDIVVDAEYDDLLNFHNEKGYDLTIVGSFQHYKIPYGILNFKEEGKLVNIEEKPEYNFVINTGVYVLEKHVLEHIPDDTPFDITDLVNRLIKRGKKVGMYPVSMDSYKDFGQWDEYKKNIDKLMLRMKND